MKSKLGEFTAELESYSRYGGSVSKVNIQCGCWDTFVKIRNAVQPILDKETEWVKKEQEKYEP